MDSGKGNQKDILILKCINGQIIAHNGKCIASCVYNHNNVFF